MKKCVVIGSGLGGLSAGVVLAKNGYEVTVLEQGSQIGGCLQCFVREGVKFETGMHFIGSLDAGQVLSNYLNYLEIKDKIMFNRLDAAGYDVVSLHGERFAFPNGREAFVERLAQRFPTQRENLERYCDLVEQVASMSPFRELSLEGGRRPFDVELLNKSIDEVIDQTITDPLLRDVLVGNLSLYAAQKGKTPFATHAFIFDFYNKGAFRIVGGSDAIVEALSKVLEQHGGTVVTRHKATRVVVENRKAKGVMTANGAFFDADVVISDVSPKQLVDLVAPGVFTEFYKRRLKHIPDTISVFSLFLHYKAGAMPYMNSNFYGFGTDSPWAMDGAVDATWPQGYLYMHHCHEPQPKHAKCGVVLAYMSMDALRTWEGTTVGQRGKEYEDFKHKMAERLLDAVEKDFPGTRDALAGYHAATPLTYRDYTLTPEGSIYGLARNVSNIADRVSFRTKVPNLLLVGQNINSHGMLGVLVGTLNVCQHLLGEEKVWRQMVESNRKSVVVVGGGLGGLVSGALLAKEGYKVTVLEKNAIIGGGLQTFKRHGVSFPTGMHLFGGFHEGGNMRKLFDYLGVTDKISLRPTDDDVSDVVVALSEGATYCLPKGKERYVAYLSERFPDEKEHIAAYINRLFELSEEEDLFYLRETPTHNLLHSDDFLCSTNQLMDKYLTNPRLKALLHYLTPLFGGVGETTPAYIYALLTTLHINGVSQFEGESQQLADALAKVIADAGGKVVPNEEVVRIRVENRMVTCVETKNGHTYRADNYISDVHPDVLLRIIDEQAFTAAFRRRVRAVPETLSSFKVFVKFKEGAFPYLNHASYCMKNWRHSSSEWPDGVMFVTPPKAAQGEFAETMVIISPMEFEQVRAWEHTSTGHRGEAYRQWKQATTEKVLDLMESIYPDFRSGIEFAFASSPLTIRDYYGNKEGSNFGFRKESGDLMLSQMSVFTKVRNLFLTGQNVNIHGLCGVSLTAIETVEALVGHNVIVRKINKNANGNE